MNLVVRVLLAVPLAGLVLAACGGGNASSTSSTTTAAAAPRYPQPTLTPPPAPWAELGPAERGQHMAAHVVGPMGELFAAYDAERFGDFSCASCHGPDARARHYEMPSPSLPVLYPTGSIGQFETVRQYPEGARFMYGHVMPAMQTLLGAAEYDATTGEGLTCFACHPHAADDDPRALPPPS